MNSFHDSILHLEEEQCLRPQYCRFDNSKLLSASTDEFEVFSFFKFWKEQLVTLAQDIHIENYRNVRDLC